MNCTEIKERLLKDIQSLNLPKSDFVLEVKEYSQTYYGWFSKNQMKIVVFVNNRSYEEVLITLIHEIVHFLQHSNPCFIRLRGKMHNEEFKRIFCYYKSKLGGVTVG